MSTRLCWQSNIGSQREHQDLLGICSVMCSMAVSSSFETSMDSLYLPSSSILATLCAMPLTFGVALQFLNASLKCSMFIISVV